MVELVQQEGRRTLADGSHEWYPLGFDRVYRTRGKLREVVGILGHAEGATFAPTVRLTPAESAALVAEINAIRATRGLSDAEPPSSVQPRDEDVREALSDNTEEGDDE
jgi:hypothetical protein